MSASSPSATSTNHAIETLARALCGPQETCSAGAKITRNRKFAALVTLLSPRIGRLIMRYRLNDLREDAEQAAALGVHRALRDYDPAKASFVTHATWQVRGELQGLRHRMRLDQRRSARSAGISTVSLDALQTGSSDSAVFEIVDDAAWELTERGASDATAVQLLANVLERLDAPQHERAIVFDHVLGREPCEAAGQAHTSEQRRQIVRRTMRNCAKMVAE
ncbi:MAG: sigma factor [Pseudomonadota bacterium]